MNNKKTYLFFSDLDETLLTTQKTVSEKTYNALSRFISRGNRFIICTGRNLDSALDVQERLGLDFPNTYIAAYNGGQIYNCDTKETVFRIGLPVPVVKDIFNMAAKYNIYVHTYNDQYILSIKDDEEIQSYRKVVRTPVLICSDPEKYLDEPPCKIICIDLHDHEKQERFRATVLEKYGDLIDTMYSSEYYLELIPKGFGKGKAVEILAEKLGIPIENTIAAGDAENDNSMLIAAGLGIAMCNGSESTKSVADVITTLDHNHDGLVEFLDRY